MGADTHNPYSAMSEKLVLLHYVKANRKCEEYDVVFRSMNDVPLIVGHIANSLQLSTNNSMLVLHYVTLPSLRGFGRLLAKSFMEPVGQPSDQ